MRICFQTCTAFEDTGVMAQVESHPKAHIQPHIHLTHRHFLWFFYFRAGQNHRAFRTLNFPRVLDGMSYDLQPHVADCNRVVKPTVDVFTLCLHYKIPVSFESPQTFHFLRLPEICEFHRVPRCFWESVAQVHPYFVYALRLVNSTEIVTHAENKGLWRAVQSRNGQRQDKALMNLEIEEPIRSLQTSLGQDIDMIVDNAVSVAAISGEPVDHIPRARPSDQHRVRALRPSRDSGL